MNRVVVLVFCLLLLAPAVTAQSNATLRRQAILASRAKDWYSAAQYYQRLFFNDSANLRIKFSYAEAARLSYDNEVALRLYQQIAAVDNGRRFPMAMYWAGHCLKTKGDYKSAKLWFGKFSKLKNRGEELNYYRHRARQETDHCDNAYILKKHPVLPGLKHLSSTVNTKASEYAPYEIDSTLYVSTIRYPERRYSSMPDPQVYSKIYTSDIRKERYGKMRALDTIINANLQHNANLTFSPGGDLMVMSRCTALNYSDYQCELYMSRLISRRWLVPYKIDKVNAPGYNTTQPHLAVVDSQQVLFFSSDRPGGEGGMDIWYSVIDSSGFSAPRNAGKNVNSPENEVSPWFVSGENTLYFSSTYHGALGGYDIFRSKKEYSGYGKPGNVGYPINSGHDDLYYSVNEAAHRVYLSSNRTGSYSDNKNNCCSDIYSFRYDTIVPPPAIDSTEMARERLRLLVPLTLFFHNDEPDPKTTQTITARSYDETYNAYMALLPEYQEVFSVDLKKQREQLALDLVTNFFADSVEQGMQDLRKFVDLMLPLLAKGDTVQITMKGYCSPLASTSYNKNLARRRISSLRNYFRKVDNGALVAYIDGTAEGPGRLLLEDVGIGELKFSKASDSFQDRRNSVYSPAAAAERKIQIIAVGFGEE